MGREEKLMEVLPPLDWDKVGTETWGDVVRQIRKIGNGVVRKSLFSGSHAERIIARESIFRPVRQPEWWNGDSEYHAPAYSEPVSDLERLLKSGAFVFTTEIIPPLHSDTTKLRSNVELVKPYVAAINFTDSSSSVARMSSYACSVVAASLSADPVLQIAARDNNRTATQSKALGAVDHGIRNILCLTGDSPGIGLSPKASMQILDIDAVQMLWILRKMRDNGAYLDGRQIKHPPKYFLGAASSPFASDPRFQAMREHKKINAGAQFLQTNLIFDPDGLDIWLEELDKRDVLKKVYILVGVTPLRSMKAALHLKNEIPGVVVPDHIIKRIEKAGNSAHEEGIAIALEQIEKIRNKQGINGIHLMTFGCESTVQRIVTESGLGITKQN